MTSTTVPKKHFVGRGDIVVDAQLSPENFYAKAFVLRDLQHQQSEIQETLSLDRSLGQTHPRDIGLVVEGASNNQERSRLGKNLLDSFALIFAQPGPEGVVATAMEKSDTEPDTYILYLAKNYIDHCSLSSLATHLKELFKPGDANKGEEHIGDDLFRKQCLQTNAWNAILRNCYPSICKSVCETSDLAGFCSSPKEIRNKIEKARNRIKDMVPHKQTYEARRLLLSILKCLRQFFFSEESNVYRKRSKPTWKNKKHGPGEPHSNPASVELMKFLNQITHQCFELLESHGDAVRAWFPGVIDEKKPPKWDIWLNKIRGLIYSIASYRRAWYDILRFKVYHNFATLEFKFINYPNKTTSIAVRCIADAGVQMGILKEGSQNKFIQDYRTSLIKHKAARSKHCPSCMSVLDPDSSLEHYLKNENDWACLWVHCEMQILNLFSEYDHLSFFNYIGCSKGPCWLCHHALRNMTSKFEMRDSHLKLYPGWKPPPIVKSPQDREQFMQVLRLLDKELEERVHQAKLEPGFMRINPDCPDLERTFLSPRTELVRQSESTSRA
ncbi:hypothetical protein Hte_003996 [Hypoxylon texense]